MTSERCQSLPAASAARGLCVLHSLVCANKCNKRPCLLSSGWEPHELWGFVLHSVVCANKCNKRPCLLPSGWEPHELWGFLCFTASSVQTNATNDHAFYRLAGSLTNCGFFLLHSLVCANKCDERPCLLPSSWKPHNLSVRGFVCNLSGLARFVPRERFRLFHVCCGEPWFHVY
jgi:hypothetical protein